MYVSHWIKLFVNLTYTAYRKARKVHSNKPRNTIIYQHTGMCFYECSGERDSNTKLDYTIIISFAVGPNSWADFGPWLRLRLRLRL